MTNIENTIKNSKGKNLLISGLISGGFITLGTILKYGFGVDEGNAVLAGGVCLAGVRLRETVQYAYTNFRDHYYRNS